MTEHAPIPVDTVEPPLEPAVRQPGTFRMWLLTIGGPVIWIVHFGAVYLLAEAACTAQRSARIDFVGAETLRVAVVALTVIAVVGCVALAVAARRAARRREAAVAVGVGVPLSLGAAVAVAATCLPVLVLAPC